MQKTIRQKKLTNYFKRLVFIKSAKSSFKKEYFNMKHNTLKANLARHLKSIETRKEMSSLCDRFDNLNMEEGAQAVVSILKKEVTSATQTFTLDYISQDLIKKLNTLQGRECFYIRANFQERWKIQAPSRVTVKCDACKLTLHFDQIDSDGIYQLGNKNAVLAMHLRHH